VLIKTNNNYENQKGKKNIFLNEENKKVLMKKFKSHMMYSKSGKAVKAPTQAKHLELKKKGYTHSKAKKK